MLSFEEIVQTAIENQHIILEMDLKKGVPLNYVDKDGRYLLNILMDILRKLSFRNTEQKVSRCRNFYACAEPAMIIQTSNI